jgi:hypothetical protein
MLTPPLLAAFGSSSSGDPRTSARLVAGLSKSAILNGLDQCRLPLCDPLPTGRRMQSDARSSGDYPT